MRHRYLTVAVLMLTTASRLLAQHPSAPASGKDDQRVLGTWEGTVDAGHGDPGTFRLVVTKDSVFAVKAEMNAMGQAIPTSVSDFKVNGNEITWTQQVMDGACKAKATLVGDAIRGEAACAFGTMTYLLNRKK